MGKSEICEYLIYLFDKHGNNFITTNSNEANARLFKITLSKIKTIKSNIVMKFMNEQGYKQVFIHFLDALAKGNVKLQNGSKKENAVLIIEDKAMWEALEVKLKGHSNNTPSYNINTEKVENSLSDSIYTINCEIEELNLADIYEEKLDMEFKKYKGKITWEKIKNRTIDISLDVIKSVALFAVSA